MIGRFLAERVAEGWMPGAAWCVERGEVTLSRGAVGTVGGAGTDSVGPTTPFDLASLTKPLVTAPLLMLMAQEGRLDLDAPIRSVLPELAGAGIASRSLLELATHTAGLAAWRPLYLRGGGLPGYLAQIVEQPEAVEPGRTLYSDLGYIVLGAVLERCSGRGLEQLFRERIARPAGLTRLDFPGPDDRFPDAAPTETGNHYERALAGQAGASFAWRERIPRGEVHDANAHGLGGIAGHAGLFGTVDQIVRLCREFTRESPLSLGESARARLMQVAPSTAGRTVGWVAASHASAARGILPGDAPGHTGFTGTSIWLEPGSDRRYVLLTHRVHPRVPRRDFGRLRRAFHRLARRL